LQWINGSGVSSVTAVTRNFNHPYIECEDFGAALIEFKNGTVGIIEGTSNVFPKNLEETLSIFGEKGTVVIGGLAVNRLQTWKFENEDSHPFMDLPDPETVYGNGHIPLFKDFCNAVELNREPCISGEEGKKAVEIILGIYLSAKTGKKVEFPLKNVSSIDFK